MRVRGPLAPRLPGSLARPWAVAVVSEKITSVSKMHRIPSVCASMRCTGCGIRDAAQGSGTACKTSAVRRFRGSPESPAVAAWRLRAAAGAGSPCARTRAYRWAARAHNRTNTMTKGVFNTLAVLRRASHCAKHRGQSKPRQGHKTWRRRGVASFLERARMQVPGRHACACAR